MIACHITSIFETARRIFTKLGENTGAFGRENSGLPATSRLRKKSFSELGIITLSIFLFKRAKNNYDEIFNIRVFDESGRNVMFSRDVPRVMGETPGFAHALKKYRY